VCLLSRLHASDTDTKSQSTKTHISHNVGPKDPGIRGSCRKDYDNVLLTSAHLHFEYIICSTFIIISAHKKRVICQLKHKRIRQPSEE